MRRSLGFSMIEALVAIAVLVVGVLGVLGLFVYVTDSSREARQIQAATLLAEQSIAKLEMESREWVGGLAPKTGTQLNALYQATVGDFVDTTGQQLNAFGVTASSLDTHEPSPFCVRIQVTHRDLVMMSGGVRVFWALSAASSCESIDPADFDIARTVPRGYGFVTIPFAVRAYQ